MISRFVGAKPEFTNDEIEGQLRTKIISSFSDSIGELKIPALDLAAKYDEISECNKKKLAKIFADMGLELLSFTLENISLPEEVQNAMDQRASLGALGDMNKYTQYQAANAMRDAAKNEGTMGNMMGFMLGPQMGNAVGNAMNQAAQAPAAPAGAPPPLPQQSSYFAAIGGQQAGPFTVAVIQQKISSNEITRDTLLWTQGMAAWSKAGDIPEIAALFNAAPPPLPPQ